MYVCLCVVCYISLIYWYLTFIEVVAPKGAVVIHGVGKATHRIV